MFIVGSLAALGYTVWCVGAYLLQDSILFPCPRAPEPDEVLTCSPFLVRQVDAIKPKAIVALGASAVKALLNTKVGITALRGRWAEFRGIPVMPTFHPSYLLRQYTKENRQAVFDDLKAARARIDEAS